MELFATRSHFDYHDARPSQQLGGWLAETGLTLHGVHAPITDRLCRTASGATAFSNASPTDAGAQAAVREAEAALADRAADSVRGARRAPRHADACRSGREQPRGGVPQRRGDLPPGRAARRAGRARSDSERSSDAAVAGRRCSNATSSVGDAGICLDFGHAHLMGDVADAIETVAEHLIATHVHDNRGRKDDHSCRSTARIDWDVALMTMQKIGYDGTYLMELANTELAGGRCSKARAARERSRSC